MATSSSAGDASGKRAAVAGVTFSQSSSSLELESCFFSHSFSNSATCFCFDEAALSGLVVLLRALLALGWVFDPFGSRAARFSDQISATSWLAGSASFLTNAAAVSMSDCFLASVFCNLDAGPAFLRLLPLVALPPTLRAARFADQASGTDSGSLTSSAST